nr:polysaccharide biosynthesis/export family protein [Rhizomicrobium palustre]
MKIAVIAGFLAIFPVQALAGGSVNPPPDATVTGASDKGFVLGPSDKLRIVFYGEDGLNTQPEYTVAANGKISLPLVGDIQAAGLTVSELQTEIIKTYSSGYLADPRFSIQVMTARPFYILGEVKTPGQYTYVPGLTVLNAVAMAGGFTYRAVTDEVKIRHAADKSEKKVKIDGDTPVYPGDTIEIRERWF